MRWLALGACVMAYLSPAAALMTIQAGAITGVVVDEASGAPVPNAIVAAVWRGDTSSGPTVCVRGDSVKADAAGKFRIGQWTLERGELDGVGVDVAGYAPGWSRSGGLGSGAGPKTWLGLIPRKRIEVPAQDLRVTVRRFEGTPTQRGESVLRLLMSTDCGGGEQAGMDPLYRAVRAELIAGPAELRHYRERQGPVVRSLLQIIDQVYLADMPAGAPRDLTPALYTAIRTQDTAEIERTAASGIDLDGPMGPNRVPSVMVAAIEWAPKSVGALVKAGANVDAPDLNGRTSLDLVLLRDLAGSPPSEQRRAMVRALLDAGADPNRWSTYCTTPIMEAAKGPDGHIVSTLIARGARVRDRCECAGRSSCLRADGRTALHYAWHPDIVRALIEAEGDVHARDAMGRTPLMQLLDYGSRSPALLQSARLLVAAGASLDAVDSQGINAATRAGPELAAALRRK